MTPTDDTVPTSAAGWASLALLGALYGLCAVSALVAEEDLEASAQAHADMSAADAWTTTPEERARARELAEMVATTLEAPDER